MRATPRVNSGYRPSSIHQTDDSDEGDAAVEKEVGCGVATKSSLRSSGGEGSKAKNWSCS